MTGPDTAYNWEAKRLSHNYLDLCESFNIEEIMDNIGDSKPGLIYWFCSGDIADDERWRSELVGATRACAFAARSKQKDMTPNNKQDPKQSMTIHDPNFIVDSATKYLG